MAVETPEFGAMVKRMLRAYGRRVADADPEDLADLVALRDELEQAILLGIDGQRRGGRASWTDVGRALGISRQGAFQRYGRPTMRDEPTDTCRVCGLSCMVEGQPVGMHECRRGTGRD